MTETPNNPEINNQARRTIKLKPLTKKLTSHPIKGETEAAAKPETIILSSPASAETPMSSAAQPGLQPTVVNSVPSVQPALQPTVVNSVPSVQPALQPTVVGPSPAEAQPAAGAVDKTTIRLGPPDDDTSDATQKVEKKTIALPPPAPVAGLPGAPKQTIKLRPSAPVTGEAPAASAPQENFQDTETKPTGAAPTIKLKPAAPPAAEAAPAAGQGPAIKLKPVTAPAPAAQDGQSTETRPTGQGPAIKLRPVTAPAPAAEAAPAAGQGPAIKLRPATAPAPAAGAASAPPAAKHTIKLVAKKPATTPGQDIAAAAQQQVSPGAPTLKLTPAVKPDGTGTAPSVQKSEQKIELKKPLVPKPSDPTVRIDPILQAAAEQAGAAAPAPAPAGHDTIMEMPEPAMADDTIKVQRKMKAPTLPPEPAAASPEALAEPAAAAASEPPKHKIGIKKMEASEMEGLQEGQLSPSDEVQHEDSGKGSADEPSMIFTIAAILTFIALGAVVYVLFAQYGAQWMSIRIPVPGLS